MSNTLFRRLIDDICALASIPDPKSMYDAASLLIDGVAFTLIDDPLGQAGSLVYFCDFGPIVTHLRAEAMQRLLEANFAMFGPDMPLFAMNFETGHVMLMGRFAIAEFTAQSMLEVFIQYAAQARHWRAENDSMQAARVPAMPVLSPPSTAGRLRATADQTR